MADSAVLQHETKGVVHVQAADSQRVRLEYLDGVRGAASFYVMLTHLVLFINPALFGSVKWLSPATDWMHYGSASVAIFIVLSGYCLMLPAARAPEYAITSGFWPYIRRRARRILPPYYAALAISIALLMLFSGRIESARSFWHTMTPLSAPVIASHVLLIHNFSNRWIFMIDAPMWSVATEWQIYFLFPLVLLPVLRRTAAALVPVGLVIGVLPMLFFRTGETAAPWFVALFAMGMIGACINFAPAATWQRMREKFVWGALCASATVMAFGWHFVAQRHPAFRWKGIVVQDLFTGAATMCLLVYCTHGLRSGRGGPAVRLLSSRPLIFLGAMSYSLYLMHTPILGACDIAIRALAMPPEASAILYVFGAGAAALLLTYPFHLVFEKPFMSFRGATSQARNKE